MRESAGVLRAVRWVWAVLPAVALAGSKPPPAEPAPWVGVVSSLVKVRPGMPLPDTRAVRLSVARGECEAFQIYARGPVRGIGVKALALRGPGKALPLTLYREAFLEVTTPSNTEGDTGAWPDPLLPLVLGTPPRPTSALSYDATPRAPLVLYAEVCAGQRQEPGSYTGVVELTASSRRPQEVHVDVEVQPFTLPATSSLPNTFGLSIYSLSRGHGVDPASPKARQLLRAYAEQALSHRVSLHGMGMDAPPVTFPGGKAKVDFRAYDEEMGALLDGTALPSGARFTTADVRELPGEPTDAERTAYYRAFREHFEARGWKAQLFFYAKDEPKPEDVPLVLRQSARVRQAGKVPVLVTSALHPRLTPAADIVCPTLNCFFPRSGAQTCEAVEPLGALRQKLGGPKRVWWYQSCNVHGCTGGPAGKREIDDAYAGWPSYMVDHPAPLNRAMGPLAFAEGVDGELYFDTVYAWNELDPWKDVFAFGGNGDGTLFYPGTPAKLGGELHAPVTSLRLKHIRDGLEDYEYLRLLAARQGEAKARALARRLTRSGYDIERDPATWEAVRRELTAALRQGPARK